MAKNMTRKGLAVGAALAIVATGFSAPANAAGLADKTFVSLTPSTGTAYTVVSGNGKTFSLTANEATSVAGSGRNVKFLVTDADELIEPKVSGSTLYSASSIAGADVAVTNSGSADVVTVEFASHTFEVDDVVSLDGFADLSGSSSLDLTGLNGDLVTVTAVTSTTISFVGGALASGDAAAADHDVTVKKVRSGRDGDGSYVVDSGAATDTSNEVLILEQGNETTTRVVTVTAWVDANGNDTIDGTEYTSETRTVTFKKASEITGTVVIDQPALGDANLTASVKTNPTLNGPQVGNSAVVVAFTRQGIAGAGYDLAAWDATNGEWDASLGVQSDTSGGVGGNTGTDWSGASAGVIAGTYTARPYILTTAIATAVSATTGSTQADDVKAEIVASANNDGGKNETAASATTVTARSGSTVTVTATIYDNASPVAKVGAGIPVTATLSGVTGTIKVNGASSSDQELTNASGQVTFTVTTTTAAASQASDAATLTIQAQNVSTNTKQAAFTINWDDASVTVYDLAVANAKNDLNRSIAKNGTVNFNFRVADQWAQALSGTFRLLVENTGNTVSSYYAAVTSGAATVSVTDGQIGGGSSITTGITVQKDVSGTWTAQTPTNTNSSNKISYTIGVLDQTDEVKLDADGANTFGGGANADDADTIATKATAAIDTRSSNAAVSVAGLTAATISGVVRHATTSAARAGARVTLTGGADMLFAANGVYQLGSITLVANASGQFVVDVYSNKAQTDTVVTVASGTASATKKVSFTVANNAGAKSWTLTVPASTTPGSTYLVKGKLTDEFGNALDTASTDNSSAAKFSVTYTGPGIVFGSLPTETNSSGEFSFAVLLGANDSGTATVTASYDYDGTGTTYTAAAASALVSVGAPAVVANIGSFSGRVAVRVENAKGSDVSVKIGKQWYKFAAKNNNYLQSWKSRKGTSVAVSVYVDGELQNVQTITVK